MEILLRHCTNTQLSFIQVVEIYQTRWTIDDFFKESKQLLGLGKYFWGYLFNCCK